MSSSTSRSTLKSAALIACVLCAASVHASNPRMLAREVSGAYDMQDGSTVRIDVVGQRVLVESAAPEYWTAPSSDLLVSPDGLRRIRLLRDLDGRVERIELQTSAR